MLFPYDFLSGHSFPYGNLIDLLLSILNPAYFHGSRRKWLHEGVSALIIYTMTLDSYKKAFPVCLALRLNFNWIIYGNNRSLRHLRVFGLSSPWKESLLNIFPCVTHKHKRTQIHYGSNIE